MFKQINSYQHVPKLDDFFFMKEDTGENPPAGTCFSKVMKLFRHVSGAIVPFIPSQHWDSKESNFAILLVFFLKSC